MGKREELIAQYAEDLSGKCGVDPDMDLLTKVTVGCGPSIYQADSALVAGSDPGEHDTIRKNFLIRKLGLAEGPDLQAGIDAALATYGMSERRKHRPVVYYLLVKHFGKEAVYA